MSVQASTDPLVRPRKLRYDKRFTIPLLVLTVIGLAGAFPGLFGAGDPLSCSLYDSLEAPSLQHPFGFDFQGCDYYTRTLYGARASLTVGLSVVVLSAFIGLLLGSVVGFYGGFFDALLGRLTEVVLSMPLVLGAAIFLGFTQERGFFHVIFVLTVFGWPSMLRLVRAQVQRVKQSDHVTAASALGASGFRLLRKHILPDALWPIVVYGMSYVAIAITAEAIISFLGVGLDFPLISWGSMLGRIQHHVLVAPHLLIPALFLSAVVASFVFIGEALRDRYDPETVAVR